MPVNHDDVGPSLPAGVEKKQNPTWFLLFLFYSLYFDKLEEVTLKTFIRLKGSYPRMNTSNFTYGIMCL
ncbi:hypothetical protein ACQ1Z1_15520, partial [Enterococcus faecalis]|uniref:hypothetical protein n=1 Tax=Enterococcus faecalis TaxID=1351 RepID=UPI003D6AB04C